MGLRGWGVGVGFWQAGVCPTAVYGVLAGGSLPYYGFRSFWNLGGL
jgi:hypothetical protein